MVEGVSVGDIFDPFSGGDPLSGISISGKGRGQVEEVIGDLKEAQNDIEEAKRDIREAKQDIEEAKTHPYMAIGILIGIILWIVLFFIRYLD